MANSIKFSAQHNPEFIKELRQKVKDYFETNNISKSGNVNLVLKSIIMILVYLTPYFLMISGVITSFYGIIFCWTIMGIGMAGVGMAVMHDANHGSYSEKQKINTFLSKSLYLLGGFPATWQYQHNTLHHGFTNIEGHDDDIDPIGLLRFSPHKPLKKVHKYQHFYALFFYGLLTLSWITIKDFSQLKSYFLQKKTEPEIKKYKNLLMKLIFSKTLYYLMFLALPLVILPIPWFWVVINFIIMHFISGIILSIIFQTAHVVPDSSYPLPNSEGNIENSWAVHQLLTTSDFSQESKTLTWLIGGLNYQIEHHLFPNICHVHYRKIAPIVKRISAKFNLPYYVQPSIFDAVRNHFRMLKILGRSNESENRAMIGLNF